MSKAHASSAIISPPDRVNDLGRMVVANDKITIHQDAPPQPVTLSSAPLPLTHPASEFMPAVACQILAVLI